MYSHIHTHNTHTQQSAVAIEYTDCIPAEG